MVVLATGAALGGRIAVSLLGKVRTVVLMSAVFAITAASAWAPGLVPAAQTLLWIGVGMHVLTAVDYVIRARLTLRSEERRVGKECKSRRMTYMYKNKEMRKYVMDR